MARFEYATGNLVEDVLDDGMYDKLKASTEAVSKEVRFVGDAYGVRDGVEVVSGDAVPEESVLGNAGDELGSEEDASGDLGQDAEDSGGFAESGSVE